MIYCRSKCRDDYKNRRTKYNKQIKEKEEELEKLNQQLIITRTAFAGYKIQKGKKEKKQKDLESKIKESFQKIMQLPDEQLFKLICDQTLKHESEPLVRENMRLMLNLADDELRKQIVKDFRDEKTKTFNEFTKRNKNQNSTLVFLNLDTKTQEYKDKISQLENQIKELEQKEIKLELPEPPKEVQEEDGESIQNLSRKDKKARIEAMIKSKMDSQQMDGSQIRNTDFSAYTLSGELGEFLGNLDDNMIAIALTGDSGAGKSYFSYQLAKLFLDNGKRVRYYSLEEGIGNLTKEKLDLFDIGKEMIVERHATLDKIDQDAKELDVIIIDSYSRISKDPEDYEILRQTHPKTIFIVIFQKTTNNTIRGGSSIVFNSSMVIDVTAEERRYGKERTATMKKSRYGTMGWQYSITRGFIVKRE